VTRSTVALVANGDPGERIAAILQTQGWRFSTFQDVEDLLGWEEREEHQLVVLWVEDASASAAQQVERLKRDMEHARIVMICADIQRWGIRAMLAAGAAGIALEQELAGVLGICLQAARVGQVCVPQQYWREIEPPVLSTREKQILGLVVMGYMNSQIAERLFVAESTVKSHLSSAFGKLGVRSRNEAVNLILDPERGLGMGILALGGEPLEPTPAGAGAG
jgi:DNA-binding NarL/FixJ family response regulator